MHWLVFSFITIILYAIHDTILKFLASQVNAQLTSILISVSAGIGLTIFFIFGSTLNAFSEMQKLNVKTIVWIVIAGLSLGAATITFMKAFNSGGAFSIALPIVYIGIIFMGVIIGGLFFKETISYKQIIGILFSICGIILLTIK